MSTLRQIPGLFVYVGVVFLNAFVDLGHKITVQNTVFKVYDGQTQIVLTAIVNALILLPFVLMFSPSGYFSDRYPKDRVMRVAAWFAVAITCLITVCYYLGNFWAAFAMTFALAVQSALYSPAKYGYIKELVGANLLSQGNAVVQAVTTVSILLSTFLFSILFEGLLGGADATDKASILRTIAPIGWILIAGSVIELVMAYRLPKKPGATPDMKFDMAEYRSGRMLKKNFGAVWNHRIIWLCIIGLSIFWAICQGILAVFPAFAKGVLAESDTRVIQGMMACAGIGIVTGSIIAGRVSRNYIETGLIPVGAVGVAIGVCLMPFLTSAPAMALTFVFLGAMGGFFIVPLNALIQYHAGDEKLARVLAGNNLVQNVIMLSALAMTSLFAIFGLNAKALFLILGVVAIGGAVYTIRRLPQSLARFFLARSLGFRYRFTVEGFKNIPESGGLLLLGNHITYLDWAILAVACPRPLRFVMDRGIYSKWYLKWLFDLGGAIPIGGGASREALDSVRELLNKGEVVCLFPEGALSRNGQLGEFKRGFEKAALDADARIVPFYLNGLWGSRFSHAGAKLKEKTAGGIKRNIVVKFGPSLPIDTVAEDLKKRVFDLGTQAWETRARNWGTIAQEWVVAARRTGRATSMVDSIGKPLSGYRALTGARLFSRLITRQSPQRSVGILMPASTAGTIVNLAAMMSGKSVVNLNYTASQSALVAAVEKAEIGHVYTSSRFLKKLSDRGIELDEVLAGVEVHILEELKEEIGSLSRIATLIAAVVLPDWYLRRFWCARVAPTDTAAILFSSGSEGQPKGVELSHANLLSNVEQTAQVLDVREDDALVGTLPTFHAFGLMATTLMPVIEGIRVVYHPDPTDVVNVAKAIARHKATVLMGTSTFFRLYIKNRRVDPLMLESLRIVVAGAEKLSPDVRSGFKEKFGKDIFEGYGATETSPVAAVNIPDRLDTRSMRKIQGSRPGSVGLPIPGTSFRVVDPDSMEELAVGEDGLILISGPQVMKGYLGDPEKSDEAIFEQDAVRWYRTGDKGNVDADGFLTIVDRYSRFAKLGGEMVSLTAVEDAVREVLKQPELELVAVNLPDPKKGEKVVLLVETADASAMKKELIQSDMNPLMIPAEVKAVEQVPKLGSGKTDFSTAREIALGH